MAQKIRVKQVRSLISEPPKMHKIMDALGLRRIGAERSHKDNNCIRGMVNKVRHLVEFQLVNE